MEAAKCIYGGLKLGIAKNSCFCVSRVDHHRVQISILVIIANHRSVTGDEQNYSVWADFIDFKIMVAHFDVVRIKANTVREILTSHHLALYKRGAIRTERIDKSVNATGKRQIIAQIDWLGATAKSFADNIRAVINIKWLVLECIVNRYVLDYRHASITKMNNHVCIYVLKSHL